MLLWRKIGKEMFAVANWMHSPRNIDQYTRQGFVHLPLMQPVSATFHARQEDEETMIVSIIDITFVSTFRRELALINQNLEGLYGVAIFKEPMAFHEVYRD